MSSPAERYAAARRRAKLPALAEFAVGLPFELDPFQQGGLRGAGAGQWGAGVRADRAGKTVVGEFAVHLALAQGRKCFYTTPIKALSNQKYNDLVDRHGLENVGLLTGRQRDQRRRFGGGHDHRGAAQHALTASPALRDLGFVVMTRCTTWPTVPGRGLGRGDHPPAGQRDAGVVVGDRVQREEFADWLVTVRARPGSW
jgi:ATP-dependent RNA helicase HelY